MYSAVDGRKGKGKVIDYLYLNSALRRKECAAKFEKALKDGFLVKEVDGKGKPVFTTFIKDGKKIRYRR
tara:strand:+ start:444 stop:650 length:207 start_codon:yes stop_codon:yes gene_type:complete